MHQAIPRAVDSAIKDQKLPPPEVQIVPLREDSIATEPDELLEGTVNRLEGKILRHQVLRQLKIRQQTVLELRYGLDDGEPKTLEAVGRVLNVTRERVRQIEVKALSRLDRSIIPPNHFLRTPLIHGVPDRREIYAARYAQEKAAREVQLRRERQAAKEPSVSNQQSAIY